MKLRIFLRENSELKSKIKELQEDFNLEISDLDENDRLRIVLEVEREMQD
jgi:hypothetical protein